MMKAVMAPVANMTTRNTQPLSASETCAIHGDNAADEGNPVALGGRRAEALGPDPRNGLDTPSAGSECRPEAAKQRADEEQRAVVEGEGVLRPVLVGGDHIGADNERGHSAGDLGDSGGDADRIVDDNEDDPTQDAYADAGEIGTPVDSRGCGWRESMYCADGHCFHMCSHL
jgi:hypothetical protein